MTVSMSPEDAELDELWRARFGQALPILGSADIVRTILAEAGDPPGPDREPGKTPVRRD